MARESTGKWVQRAASTGGGRTYRSQVPTNWYAALVVIVILGVVSVVYSRYEYRRTAAAVQPTVGTTWFAGLDFVYCGTSLPTLAASTNASTVGISTSGSGVVKIAPTKASQAGDNATLGQFVDGYHGLSLTATSLQYPGKAAYRNGATCAAGTPDAGKSAVVQVRFWKNLTGKTSTLVTGDPRALKWAPNSFVTVAFAPKGATITKSSAVELAVLRAVSGSTAPASIGATSTTTPSSSTTTAPTATSTTAKK